MTANQLTILLVTLLGFFVLISLVSAQTYHIVIDHTSCPTETTPTGSGLLPVTPTDNISVDNEGSSTSSGSGSFPDPFLDEDCLTLTQYAQSPATTIDADITLSFEPGNHTLDSRLQIQNVNNLVLQVTPTNSSSISVAIVTCTNSTGFDFANTYEISVKGLEFSGCRENSVRSVDQLMIEDCRFQNGHGMELRNVSSANFERNSFISLTAFREAWDPWGRYVPSGGAIVAFSSDINVTGCLFEGNSAVDGYYGDGGAIWTDSGSITINGSNFSNNTAEFGGAIRTSSGSINVYGSNFRASDGGAIKTSSGSINVYGSNFRASDGGAIKTSSGSIDINSSNFSSNTAGDGGAIGTHSGSISIHNSDFSSNTAGWGGAIWTSRGYISIHGSKFSNNTANDGGAIASSASISINIHGCDFSGNTARDDGGAIWTSSGSISIHGSVFIRNTADSLGGAIRTVSGNIDIHSACDFSSNRAGRDGGAILTNSGSITINGSSFNNNSVATDGGAIWTKNGNIMIQDSSLLNNTADRDGGAIWTDSGNLDIQNSEFISNIAGTDGGAIGTDSGSISIDGQCDFNSNTANTDGGVLWTARGNISIEESDFTSNTASSGGVLRTDSGSISIHGGVFIGNTALNDGGVLFLGSATESINEIINSIFNHNHAANQGGAIHAQYRTINLSVFIQITNNSATKGVVYVLQSTLELSGYTIISDNRASIYTIESEIRFNGHTSIENNSHMNDGGAITAFQQSEIRFRGKVNILGNIALNGHGGAILLDGSRIHTHGNTTIAYNTALSGGGIYAYQSTLISVTGTTAISENVATKNGGGIYASGSNIKLTGGQLKLIENRAEKGGGICLEQYSHIRVKKRFECFNHDCINQSLLSNHGIYFTNNTAAYGGALFISDESSSCDDNQRTRECFLQELVTHIPDDIDDDLTIIQNIFFEDNSANISGGAIFGGLLDRCTVNLKAQDKYQNGSSLDAISFLTNITNLKENDFSSEVSSETAGLCFCDKNNRPDCNKLTPLNKTMTKKGETFSISLVAVDHVNNPVEASVRVSLSPQGDLVKGQNIQNTTSQCTELIFTITSLNDWEELMLDTEGPCKNRKTVNVTFAPCDCPPGFVKTEQESDCSCECDPRIYPNYIDGCSFNNTSVMRKDNIWISYRNESENESHYLINSHCPFDYCHPSSSQVWINLNTPSGSDAQCAFNRSGKLCGSCEDGLSLSLGSSRCLSCSNNWLALLIVFGIAGVALVVFLLVCNLTVAVGTINGFIFYANILTTNRATFFPFQSIFIAWLNLDFAFTTCFFDGMDGYAKEWLQLAFPIYIIFLVTMVIIGCEYSTKIAKIFVGTNPVATLATLILLSYAKSLRIVIAAFSSATLKNLNGSQEIVWLVDANIYFLKGKHIYLFLIALLILLVGIVYTFFLFSYQWLLRCPNRMVKLIKNARFYPFMDAYLAPYNIKHRYWTGLLLLIRAFLYIVASINVSGDPGNNLITIIYTMVFFLILRILLPGRIYKSWPLDALELSFIFNLILFSAGSLYILEAGVGNQEALAYSSTCIAFITFLAILTYHTYAFALPKKVQKKLDFFILKMKLRLTKQELIDPEIILVPRHTVTYSVVDPPATQTTILEPEQTSHKNISTNKHLKIRKSLKRFFDETRMDKIEQQKGTGYTELETRSSEFSDIPYIRDSDELGMERETELNDFTEVAD